MTNQTAQFSIMNYDNAWLIVKTLPAGNQMVVAEAYLENYAQTICQLLQTDEVQKYEADNAEGK